MKKLSDSELIVIQELFRNPKAELTDLKELLEKTVSRPTRTKKGTVDVRSVSKFKSVGFKKIREGLEKLANDFRLDYSLQADTDEEKEKETILYRNGILIGHDFRIDREITFFYSSKEESIIPWQDHLCNVKCEEECSKILKQIRLEHGLESLNAKPPYRDHFELTINEITEREIKKNV
ncbi:MAG: hypothetical protein ACTSQ9_04850 [Candidatus Hodarchaeales archaeon]